MEQENYVLIIESDSERARSLTRLCQKKGYQVRLSPDPLHGLMRALIDLPAMILVDDADRWLGSRSIEAALSRNRKLCSVPCLLLDYEARVPRAGMAQVTDAELPAGWNDQAGLCAQLLSLGVRIADISWTTANSREISVDRAETLQANFLGRGLISASRALGW